MRNTSIFGMLAARCGQPLWTSISSKTAITIKFFLYQYIVNRTFFAYHLTHVFGPFGLDNYYTNSEKPREGDFVYVLSGDKDQELEGTDYSLEGIFRIHRRHNGPWLLKNLRAEDKKFLYRLSMIPVRIPDAPIQLSQASWYSRDELRRYFASGQNFNPLPTDPDYKTRLDELLAGFSSAESDELLKDLLAIEYEAVNVTERDALVKARIGQGKFRADVVSQWRKGEACALTGVAIPEMLTASHIKPWRESSNTERLDSMNGLMLVAHADRLFDRYLMSFREERTGFVCVLHPRVREKAAGLGIKAGTLLDTSNLGFANETRFRRYMGEHFTKHEALVERDKPTSDRKS